MKYHYYYQDKTNAERDGWIDARDRNDAHSQLRRRGIKPYKIIGKNPVAWKRWAAIGVLSVALAVAFAYIFSGGRAARHSNGEAIPRHQIFGDPAIIANGIASGWSACGLDAGETFLARYAQPGAEVAPIRQAQVASAAASLGECLKRKLVSEEKELTEYRQLKEIVESMKDELRAYVANGGRVGEYVRRLQERQTQEVAYSRAALQEIAAAKKRMDKDDLYDFWAKKNAELRSIGLPTAKFPED